MAINTYIEILSRIRNLSHSEQKQLLDELTAMVSSTSSENLRTLPNLEEFRASIQLQGEPMSETVKRMRKEERS